MNAGHVSSISQCDKVAMAFVGLLLVLRKVDASTCALGIMMPRSRKHMSAQPHGPLRAAAM